MKFLKKALIFLAAVTTITAYSQDKPEKVNRMFGKDLEFLRKHTDVVLLSDTTGKAQVIILPTLQGRVITSTADGENGLSLGWVNRDLIASGRIMEHINAYGGEDRIWLGPEGGQFSIFFRKGASFDIENWYTPAPLDTEPFDLVSKSTNKVVLQKHMKLENYSGTIFNLRLDREITVLEHQDAIKALGIAPAETVKMVAFQSSNKMTNAGTKLWEKETGLLSIWILGMFDASSANTVVVPFNPGPEGQLGPIVNDAYLGKIPADRLIVKHDTLFFKADGRYYSKIGLTPQRAKSVFGSFDALKNVLTIVQYNKPDGVLDYVNSMLEIQDQPYRGDVINSYNDGPPKPDAKPLGPFYELETSSPAAALKPGETIHHLHRTYHFQGSQADLDHVAKTTLGITIAQIKSALPN